MKISGLLWLEDIVQKLIWKHSVTQSEILEVFKESPRFRFVEKGNRRDEDVYTATGQTIGGRYLVIFFVYKRDRQALILSARDMSAAEQKKHEKK